MLLKGQVNTWSLFGRERTFGTVVVPFEEASSIFSPNRYSALKNKGEQRELTPSHVKKLVKAMKAGTYVPTPASVSLYKLHRESLNFDGKHFSIEIDRDKPLPLIDAGHRFAAIQQIIDELRAALEIAEGDVKTALEEDLKQALSLPIQTTIYFDGDPKEDFCSLQEHRRVDASHLFSLKLQHKLFGDSQDYKLAFDTAKILAKNERSPFKGYIRFDSSGMLPLGINTLCSRGASDIATSLIGLARAGAQNAEWLSNRLVEVFEIITADAADLLEEGMLLAPPGAGGRKGSSCLLIGLSTVLAWKLHEDGLDEASEEILERVVLSAKEVFNDKVRGNLSGPLKRKLMGQFASEFFSKDDYDMHEGVPVDLVKTLSPSTFAVEPLPKKSPEPELVEV